MTCWVLRSDGVKPNCRTAIPGNPSDTRSFFTGGVITPRSSAISGG